MKKEAAFHLDSHVYFVILEKKNRNSGKNTSVHTHRQVSLIIRRPTRIEESKEEN